MSSSRKSSLLTNEDFSNIKNSLTEESQQSLQNIEQELDQLKEKAINDRHSFQNQIQTLKQQLQQRIGALEDSNEKRNKLVKKSQKLKMDRCKLLEQIQNVKKKMTVLSRNNLILQNKVRELLLQKDIDNETNIETNLDNEAYTTVNVKKYGRAFVSMSDLTNRSELPQIDNSDLVYRTKPTIPQKSITEKKKFLKIRHFKKKRIISLRNSPKVKNKKKFRNLTPLNIKLNNDTNSNKNKDRKTKLQVEVQYRKREKNNKWSKHIRRRKSLVVTNNEND
ncbi:hypothetical protein M0813_20190 [Anaeramoeba flamelloides]|uniref:Uncharacterized protein n=1 Tax=Anaeramoeba flamelloides TaxID=1746091 RepID=A0ABQ8YMQ9_9EUKA|nr:hypothetical protein M0813_20190 [Anaeramoeba flamelloides]